ncbi:MAG: DUF429 domain-containing protein [Chloroflexota bacterium]
MSEKIYWGIDGCKGGWIAIGLQQDGAHHIAYAPDIATFWAQYCPQSQLVLIDMPIGLTSDSEGRLTEDATRQVLGNRHSSVFPVPTRDAIEHGGTHGFTDEHYRIACDINRDVEGKAFSKQSWNISGKIYELDTYLRQKPSRKHVILESHPEVMFWALNNQTPMAYSKKSGLGFNERLSILKRYQPNALEIIEQAYTEHRKVLADDDIVDGLALAIGARMSKLRTLPSRPKIDDYGLPMQIVYPKI